ncbi:MAG: DNA mismatch repair endonuclease MutL [Chloroflexi bacterium]|nr:DNA mismatch repair endonuclease MutL [Chloroflexota bacterium]
MPIKVLSPELAAQIAAGEVVERPASVVKELVENSLDAGASQVTVEIRGGGVDQLRVTDDGQGIPTGEVELAFQHHATSKLETQEQLEVVATLGFRGEALASIAAVSRLVMTTCTPQAGSGHRIEFQWGIRIGGGAQGCPAGTTVEVRDLFGNLPARRKFLKSNSTESARVQELVTRYALAYPHTRFQLTVDGRNVLTSPGNGKPREALLAVYGPEAANGMLEVQGEEAETGYRVTGFAGGPSLHRANRSYMAFFVNRRWIQSRMLSFALEEAYHGLLPEKRYPMAAINLEIPYGDLDVNCHPAKREVRFHQEGKVFSTLQKAVRAALVADSPVPALGMPGRGAPSVSPSLGTASFFSPGSLSRGQNEVYSAPADAAFPQQRPPSLKVVGQVKLTYIVAETADGMYLVDQHAAHERVLFDQLRRRAEERSPESQPLLEPVVVELSPGQAQVVQEQALSLEAYGFAIEPFGENTRLLRAVPAIVATQDPGQALVDVLDMVAFEGLVRQQEDVLAASIACHSAIRAGRPMTQAEMEALLEQLDATDNPHTCPHGRPTMLHFSASHMDREFGRR